MRPVVPVLLGAALLAIVMVGVWRTTQRTAADAEAAQGGMLFRGEGGRDAPLDSTLLRGRIVGHTQPLPVAATRCVGCHSTTALVLSSEGAGTTAADDRLSGIGFGPVLNADTLRKKLARRGGPPSAYDASSLCRVLREGIDPAWVMVATTMPRYEASDAQCAALWAWLMRQPGNGRGPSTPTSSTLSNKN